MIFKWKKKKNVLILEKKKCVMYASVKKVNVNVNFMKKNPCHMKGRRSISFKMADLYRCEICGKSMIGITHPANCPFCGVKGKYMKLFDDSKVDFDVSLSEKDKNNVEIALNLELSNTDFYRCSSEKLEDKKGKELFDVLSNVEYVHAYVWMKILKMKEPPEKLEKCSDVMSEDLKESLERESKAIEFYRKAADEASNAFVKKVFESFTDVEKDHLQIVSSLLKINGGKEKNV